MTPIMAPVDTVSGRTVDQTQMMRSPKILRIEFRLLSEVEACHQASITLDFWLYVGHVGRHVRECGTCVDNVQLMVGDQIQIVHEYMGIAHLASVRDQLHATPGVLRVTVVHSSQCPQGA